MKKVFIAFALLANLASRAQVIDPLTGLPKNQPQNKGIIRQIREGEAEVSTDQGKTWKKAAVGNALPETMTPPQTAATLPPSYLVPPGQNSYQAGFQQRLSAVVNSATATEASETSVICFQPMAPKNLDELTEDLQVLNLLLNRNLERAIGDKPFEVKLGVAMRMPMSARSVRVSYLQDYGVNIRVNVPFPVVPAPGEKQKKSESRGEESDWEKARRAIHGGDFDPNDGSTDAPVYSDELVTTLKKEMLEGLRNAKNLRHVKSDEWVSLTVIGGNSTYSPRRPSVLAMRVKKSAAEKASSTEDLEKQAQINAYLDPAASNDNPNNVRDYRRGPKPSSAIAR